MDSHAGLPLFSISIHALREEGDIGGNFPRKSPQKISIHALREEGDRVYAHGLGNKFISIHALREEGDANVLRRGTRPTGFLSTPSARRATLESTIAGVGKKISIPPPPEAGDTAKRPAPLACSTISIPAPREEGDGAPRSQHRAGGYFYPRPPRGGRPSNRFTFAGSE